MGIQRIFLFCLILGFYDTQGQILLDLNIAGNPNYTDSLNADAVGSAQYGVRVYDFGDSGASSGDVNAGSGSGTVTIAGFTQTGQVEITPPNPGFADSAASLLLELTGGDGGDQTSGDADKNAGDGGDAGGILATNTGRVEISGDYGGPVSIFDARSVGGTGGSVTPKGTNNEGQP